MLRRTLWRLNADPSADRIPYWKHKQTTKEKFHKGFLTNTPNAWTPSDEGRDPSVKYTKEEMQVRYGQTPVYSRVHSKEICEDQGIEPEYEECTNVPADMYTYGAEGDEMTGINIFKDQKPAKIRALDEYPFIWNFLAGDSRRRPIEDLERLRAEGKMTAEVDVFYSINRSHHDKGQFGLYKRGPVVQKKMRAARGAKKK